VAHSKASAQVWLQASTVTMGGGGGGGVDHNTRHSREVHPVSKRRLVGVVRHSVAIRFGQRNFLRWRRLFGCRGASGGQK